MKVQQAKRILEDNISYLSKECYMRLNQDVCINKDPETINVLLQFKNHHSVDILVRNCMLLYNEQEYNRLVNKTSNSPVRNPGGSAKGQRLSSGGKGNFNGKNNDRSPYDYPSSSSGTQKAQPKMRSS